MAAGAALWTLIAYQVSLGAGVMLVVGSVVLVAVLVRPIVGVYLALLAVPLEQIGLQAGTAELTPAKLLLVLTGGAAAAHFAYGVRPARIHPAHVAFGALVLFGLLGLTVTEDSLVTIKILGQWAAYLLVAIYVATCDAAQLRRLLVCLMLAGGVMGALALTTFGDQRIVAGGQAALGRARAGFNHPANLAFFLVLALPPALVLAFRARALLRLPTAAASVLCIAGIMLSLTRGAIIGAVFALLVMLVWAEFRRMALAILAVLLVFGAFNLEAIQRAPETRVIAERLASITEAEPSQDNLRLKIWEKTPRMVVDHPFFGVGAGNFANVSPRYNVVDVWGLPFLHGHNVFLTIAAEFGLIGLALFLCFVGAVVLEAVRVVLRYRERPSFPYALALAASLTGLFVNGMTDYPPGTLVIMGTLMIVVGAFIGFVRVLADEGPGPVPARGRPAR